MTRTRPRPDTRSAPGATRRVRPLAAAACAAVGVLALAGCGSGSGSAAVAVPQGVTGVSAQQCAALTKSLPEKLNGLKRRDVKPASALTAAWGSPAVTLRCGVPRPGVIDPASPQYDPTGARSEGMDVNGLCWVSVQNPDKSYQFTTVRQHTYVEVNVPAKYYGQESPLPALTRPVSAADPQDPVHQFECS